MLRLSVAGPPTAQATGIPGIIAARDLCASKVAVTDALPKLVDSLSRNIKLNLGESGLDQSAPVEGAAAVQGCPVEARRLDWAEFSGVSPGCSGSEPLDQPLGVGCEDLRGNVDIVLGAEVIWAGCDPCPLVLTIRDLLKPGAGVDGGLAFILMPQGGRGAEVPLLACARDLGLELVSTENAPVDLGTPEIEKNSSSPVSGSAGHFNIHLFRRR